MICKRTPARCELHNFSCTKACTYERNMVLYWFLYENIINLETWSKIHMNKVKKEHFNKQLSNSYVYKETLLAIKRSCQLPLRSHYTDTYACIARIRRLVVPGESYTITSKDSSFDSSAPKDIIPNLPAV